MTTTTQRVARTRIATAQDRRLEALADAALAFREQVPTIEAWGRRLAGVLRAGGRLLACGNGGSAAEAQHLTAELVGRFEDERRPLSAIPLHGDTSSFTAIGNDYGPAHVFARQVQAHGRRGDVLVCLSTSGRSPNVITAADRARELGMTAWAVTGPGPNPLADACHDAITVRAAATSTVQEIHLAAVHLLCGVVDDALGAPRA
ncbi:D-sedoheptulose-7-phosphate isomerase [Actinomadura nitritigenes]|uniref:SIS domain-containing protein n=1 Tax=Actinomadura nitritigenes TaxID=134602 RepID=A0ABS3R5Q9_9ACTN|nr:SIS domain-containing protein [Actinomadura nitritigenes]MBO2441481.1 SIS domain-containing protein [Actinomadura nitritigenes]